MKLSPGNLVRVAHHVGASGKIGVYKSAYRSDEVTDEFIGPMWYIHTSEIMIVLACLPKLAFHPGVNMTPRTLSFDDCRVFVMVGSNMGWVYIRNLEKI